jgi:hypothetical protein
VDAEESVLGAILLDERVLDAVAGIVSAADFFRPSHGTIFEAMLALRDAGQPVDAITVADALARAGKLDEIRGDADSGKQRVHELAALVPATGNAGHYAGIVAAKARERRLLEALKAGRRAVEAGQPPDRDAIRAALDDDGARRSFSGLDFSEIMSSDLAALPFLIPEILPAGVVGFVVGVPECGKSALALGIARAVLTGGEFLGQTAERGAVGIWVQDGSEAASILRTRRALAGLTDAPVRLHAAEGLRIPRDLAALRAEIEHRRQRLVILDSAYNFLDGGLRDEEAAVAFALLKRDVVDRTGATALVVDHAPWPTEANAGQRRAYGSVFKQAAARVTLFLDRKDANVLLTVSGNDVAPQSFALLLKDGPTLVRDEEPEQPQRDLAAEIADYLARHGPETKTNLAKALEVRRSRIEEILAADPRFQRVPPRPGMRSDAKPWTLTPEACPDPPDKLGQGAPSGPPESLSPDLPIPCGDGSRDRVSAHACPEDAGQPDRDTHEPSHSEHDLLADALQATEAAAADLPPAVEAADEERERRRRRTREHVESLPAGNERDVQQALIDELDAVLAEETET